MTTHLKKRIKEAHTTKEKLLHIYLYLRLILDRGGSHTELIMGTFQKIMIFSVFLKVYGINNLAIIITCGITFLIGVALLGHYDVKHNILSTETSLRNAYNPELKKLLQKRRNQ